MGLNLVIIWTKTIQKLWSYLGYLDDWEVFTYYDRANFVKITANEILIDPRATADCIRPKEIGTHSIRASLAMMMYLAKEPIYTIMLIGRWSSDAFIAYIKKSQGVHKRRQHENAPE